MTDVEAANEIALLDRMSRNVLEALGSLREHLRVAHQIDGHLFHLQVEAPDDATDQLAKPRAVSCLGSTCGLEEGAEFVWSECPNLDTLWSAQGADAGVPTVTEVYHHETPELRDVEYAGGITVALRQGKLPPHNNRLAPDVTGFLSFQTVEPLSPEQAAAVLRPLRSLAYLLSAAWGSLELARELAGLRHTVTVLQGGSVVELSPSVLDRMKADVNRLEAEVRRQRDEIMRLENEKAWLQRLKTRWRIRRR